MSTPAPWAHIPGVTYPAPAAPRRVRPAIPAGCPHLVAGLEELAKWVAAAHLWPAPGPSLRTLQRWKAAGLIVTVRGAVGHSFIDVPATLSNISPK